MTNPTLPTMSELARLRPADVVTRPVRTHRAPVPRTPVAGQHVETLIGTRKAIRLEIRRLGRRLVDTGVERVIQSGPHAGLLELRVIVKDAATTPRWAKVCLGAGLVLAPVGALALAVWWLLTSLTPAAVIGFAAVVLVVLAVIVCAGRGGSGRARGVYVQVTTSVHVR